MSVLILVCDYPSQAAITLVMSGIASRTMSMALFGGKSWPDDVKLYQPFEVDQILMHEFACCLSVKTLLNMIGLKYQMELRTNAEHMSPTGVVPFIQVGSNLIAGFDEIVSFINLKGYSLTENLTQCQMADMKSFVHLVQSILGTALVYIMWMDYTAYNMITKTRYGFQLNWPLNVLVPWRKRKEIITHLSLLGWQDKTLEEVVQEVTECCKALSNKLEGQNYFIGDKPTELDALVFGYLFTILTTPLPDNVLADKVREYEDLTEFCKRIHDNYFADKEF